MQIQKTIFNRWTAFVHDIIWVVMSVVLAYFLRFNFEGIPEVHRATLYVLVVFAPVVQGSIFWIFGLYRGFWRFASIPDLIRIFKAVAMGTLVITVSCGILTRYQAVPRSVFFLYPLLLSGGLCGPRLLFRWMKSRRFILRKMTCLQIVIVGAGRAGEMLVRDLLNNQEYDPLAFLDDDPTLLDREIHGVRVVGNTGDIARVVSELNADLVILAIPSADKKVISIFARLCQDAEVPCQTLPSVLEMEGREIDAASLRSITVDDLLGRESVQLDKKAIAKFLSEKTVVVTGGGGSIGSELCRQILAQKPARLVIVDNGEFNLYSIDHELRIDFPDLQIETILGDVKDLDRIDWIFSEFRPDVVFHAAAYKHVPMVEGNPAEGVRNNVYGTQCVADAVDRYNVGCFVLVSTDKAVNPTNVMGTTKRVAELYCQNLDRRSKSSYVTTRFGNVLGSAGSVVPLFQKQIETGGPVTVTHPEITRYFMTIPEAVALILQAGAMGQGGEIFVLDMGQPVLIEDLAKQMIRLAGLNLGEDIEITYTGLRPGEKLFEELLHESEGLQPTNHEKLLLGGSREVSWSWLDEELEKLRNAATSRDVKKIYYCLQGIVPEFQFDKTKYDLRS